MNDPCSDCGRPAQVVHYASGKRRPLCWTCFHGALPGFRIPAPVLADAEIDVQYDYDNQAWIENGSYISCSHPDAMNCTCYGKIHAGERAPSIH